MYKNKQAFIEISEFGRKLLTRPSLEIGIPIISSYAKKLLEADRCSVFIYDEQKHNLWTVLADGTKQIRISANEGIVGAAFRDKKPLLVNDPYSDERFSSKVDKETGYITHNIIAIPILNAFNEAIGVLQLLNKKSGDFSKEDIKLLTFFNHYISGYVELANYFDEEPS